MEMKVMSACALADLALNSAIGLPKAKHQNHEDPSNRVLEFSEVSVTKLLWALVDFSLTMIN
ncbi:unnamed protein product [Sphenostylis stenocarpa]|uniref:Uncharacterized protein n=1 Tax=Sphenostylis stenocarpa TaxID=92480 RepID=A0AA86SDJ7_9FABA|nr:unnamed protein product [Sphenostylis stenocarpa]